MKDLYTRLSVLIVVAILSGSQALYAQCDIPLNLQSSNIADNSADLSWDASPDAISYNVVYKPASANTWISANTPATSLSIFGLISGTDYQWKVKAICSSSSSLFASTQEFTTTGSPGAPNFCDHPVNPNATSIGNTGATLNWDAVTNAVSYNVVYRLVGITNWTSIVISAPATSIILSNLFEGSDYEWKVKTTCDNAVTSKFGPTQNFSTTGSSSCGFPTNRSTSFVTTESAKLNWDFVGNGLSYFAQYRIVGTSVWSSKNTSNNFALISGLVSGTTYEWKVRTNCIESQTSIFSPVTTFTTEGDPGPPPPTCDTPTGLTVSNILDDGATLSWNAVSDVNIYTLIYRTTATPNGPWDKIITTNTSEAVSGLFSGTDYQWKVSATCNNDVISLLANGEDFTTTGTPPGNIPSCEYPSNLSTSGVSSDQAILNFDAVSNALNYNIVYRSVGDPFWTSISTTGTSNLVTGLTPSTDYEWKVRTNCDNALTSLFAPVSTFTTNATTQAESITNPGLANSILAYPNPVINQASFEITVPHKEVVSLRVFDLSGNLVSEVYSGSVNPDQKYQFTFDRGNLSPGIYTYVITTSRDIYRNRLILK